MSGPLPSLALIQTQPNVTDRSLHRSVRRKRYTCTFCIDRSDPACSWGVDSRRTPAGRARFAARSRPHELGVRRAPCSIRATRRCASCIRCICVSNRSRASQHQLSALARDFFSPGPACRGVPSVSLCGLPLIQEPRRPAAVETFAM